ncbi:MAG: hypothetical protein B6D41_04635 [Chloroflexi bacterium UTCFX4]|nr:MAG: hypothetical protein B6D41_04635 [Chloroflexi bacterium UTCFX4]
MENSNTLKLKDGARIAVIGGGPAGSFFSNFVLMFADRLGLDIHVDIYEPRDFSLVGPPGCNMCAGIVSESLVQNMATEGINFPTTVVQRGIDSYVLYMDVGTVKIDSSRREKRIGATYRGSGPRDVKEVKWDSLDRFLMNLALEKGAQHIRARITDVKWDADAETTPLENRRLVLKTQNGKTETYDFVAVTAGVNTAILKAFQELNIGYQAPQTTKAYIREYYLGDQAIGEFIGPSFHAFLPTMPNIEFGAIVPKGEYVTLALLGEDIDTATVDAFMADPTVKECMPPGFAFDKIACWCGPRINITGSAQPYGDRVVFIGDSGVTRLYKDGMGAAYRAAKAAASNVVFHGIARDDLAKQYGAFCRAMETDNNIGKFMFAVVRQIQRFRFSRRAILRMASEEQKRPPTAHGGMSMVLWDMFTGSAPYREVFIRTLHPVFWTRLAWNMAVCLVTRAETPATTRTALET